MTTPIVSIIIPCYNSGKYLSDAIESVELYPDKNIYEIIIINDGSIDEPTIALLKNLEDKGYHIIHQTNKGPAAARNTGIRSSKGQYLLFLDSDNKIRPEFIDFGIKLFSEKKEVGVVYGNAAFFGERTDARFEVGAFDLDKLFICNYIDMCSMVRKSVFEELGPLDEAVKLIGNEDWEYWIRVGLSNWKFYYEKEIFYDYRIRENSLTARTQKYETFNDVRQHVYSKYLDDLLNHYRALHYQATILKEFRYTPFKAFVKYFRIKFLGGHHPS